MIEIEEKLGQKSEQSGYKYSEKRVNYYGIEQRWLITESEKRIASFFGV
ncbi:hypothetical protein GM3708_17 [Geminocystis sp. NIES-3708]|nr:hypothetical protein [Geminocystis sp. NIES-3708]BAQ59612.1 hypothetical protein GM3708_17 [Geminocystis sp. NIES-3708]